jgi:hypothetical protein
MGCFFAFLGLMVLPRSAAVFFQVAFRVMRGTLKGYVSKSISLNMRRSHLVTVELTERIEDGRDDVRFLESTDAGQIDGHCIARLLRQCPRRYELFDEIHLLSFEAAIENWLLLIDWGSNGSKSQPSADQGLEEHSCS